MHHQLLCYACCCCCSNQHDHGSYSRIIVMNAIANIPILKLILSSLIRLHFTSSSHQSCFENPILKGRK